MVCVNFGQTIKFGQTTVPLQQSCQSLTTVCVAWQVVIAEVGEKDSSYGDMLDALPANDCRYAGRHSTGLGGPGNGDGGFVRMYAWALVHRDWTEGHFRKKDSQAKEVPVFLDGGEDRLVLDRLYFCRHQVLRLVVTSPVALPTHLLQPIGVCLWSLRTCTVSCSTYVSFKCY